jgi:hypothetical protein
MPMLQCHQCGASVSVNEPLSRDAECETCKNDLRCCVNCVHYDTNMNNSCRETQADPVVEKTRRNFCEYFVFTRQLQGPGPKKERPSDARAKLEALFKPKPTP